MISNQNKNKDIYKRKHSFPSETPSPKNRSNLSKNKQQHKDPPIDLESLWCFEFLKQHNIKTSS